MESGDIVTLDYEAWVADSDDLLETTDEDLARDHGIYDGGRVYGPVPVILGDNDLVEGLEEAVLKADVGSEQEVEIPPEKGYGERDPDDVEIFSRREFRKRDITPEPGTEVQIRNRRGRVISVTPGRVRVDFNPRLAGQTLRYTFTVRDLLKDPAEKVEAIIAATYNRSHAEDFEIHVDEETARIVLPDISKFDPNWFDKKADIIDKIRNHAGVREVVFIEEHAMPEGAEEEADEEGEEDPVVEASEEDPSETEAAESSIDESEEE